MEKFGDWPYVDIVLVKDYEQSAQGKGAPRCFVRIHMDIPIKESDASAVDGMLKKSEHKKLYDTLLQIDTKTDPRGLATLKAALGV